jgi:hypothetical protein
LELTFGEAGGNDVTLLHGMFLSKLIYHSLSELSTIDIQLYLAYLQPSVKPSSNRLGPDEDTTTKDEDVGRVAADKTTIATVYLTRPHVVLSERPLTPLITGLEERSVTLSKLLGVSDTLSALFERLVLKTHLMLRYHHRCENWVDARTTRKGVRKTWRPPRQSMEGV